MVAFLGLAGGVLYASCRQEEERIRLTNSDSGRTVTVQVGDRFDIALDVLGPVYYGTPVVTSASVRFLGEFDEFPAVLNPGGGKTQRYEFEALSAGEADITIQRELPAGNSQTFQITVGVY